MQRGTQRVIKSIMQKVILSSRELQGLLMIVV